MAAVVTPVSLPLTFQQAVEVEAKSDIARCSVCVSVAQSNLLAAKQELTRRSEELKSGSYKLIPDAEYRAWDNQPWQKSACVDPVDQKRIYDYLVYECKLNLLNELPLKTLFTPVHNAIRLCVEAAKPVPAWIIEKYGSLPLSSDNVIN